MLEFVFRDHLRLALDAALLFAVGLFASYPVVRYNLRGVAAPAVALFRLVVRLIGTAPTPARTAAVIWACNSLIMFVDMASGFHPLLPKVLCLWTGLNVGIMAGMAPQEADLLRAGPPGAGQWAPGPALTRLCALLVLVLELPCLFYAVAMGMNMGLLVQSGTVRYLPALSVRGRAYAGLIVPILLVSAVAETLAIRGAAAVQDGSST
jgi:hypothetical protein